ncbi:MAG: SRPBCC family protein [Gemmatimonadetes bacterium]|nr:SRPBCC family protein [Gemmatimonadota bacterium]
MSASTLNAPSPTADREIVTTRVFQAPRERVFDAYTDAGNIGRWWGPRGFTTTTHEMDVRPGGVWRNTMHSPDGTDYPNYVVYSEVVRPERLVWDHGTVQGEPPQFHATVTFEEVEGGTRVTLRTLFPTAAARDLVVRDYGAVEGARDTLDRLAEHLGV